MPLTNTSDPSYRPHPHRHLYLYLFILPTTCMSYSHQLYISSLPGSHCILHCFLTFPFPSSAPLSRPHSISLVLWMSFSCAICCCAICRVFLQDVIHDLEIFYGSMFSLTPLYVLARSRFDVLCSMIVIVHSPITSSLMICNGPFLFLPFPVIQNEIPALVHYGSAIAVGSLVFCASNIASV